jgi:class 3 adenylate cyclase
LPDSNNNSYYQWREDVEGDNIYGDGVNVAARIQALADPGGIYVSRGAAEQVRDKVPIKIETRGEQTVKTSPGRRQILPW